MGLERLDGTEPTGRVQQPPRYFYADGPEADLWGSSSASTSSTPSSGERVDRVEIAEGATLREEGKRWAVFMPVGAVVAVEAIDANGRRWRLVPLDGTPEAIDLLHKTVDLAAACKN